MGVVIKGLQEDEHELDEDTEKFKNLETFKKHESKEIINIESHIEELLKDF